VTADNPLAIAKLATFSFSPISRTTGGIGVYGQSDAGYGMYALTQNGTAVFGQSDSGTAVFAASASGRALYAESGGGDAIQALCESDANSAVIARHSGKGFGVWATSQGIAIHGEGPGTAVHGESQNGNGVLGVSHDPTNAAVSALNDKGGPGLRAESRGGTAAHFEGSIEVTANVTVGGSVNVTGDVSLANRDICERFPAVSPIAPAGAVMVASDDGRLAPCVRAYDTRVIGVVSGAGFLRPAMTLGARSDAVEAVPIALVGTVCCLADAAYGAIAPGDLLTTSETNGHAMRVADAPRSSGAVIGKAVGTLSEGRGLVPMVIGLR
jgi:hypothetical protein